MSRIKKHLTPSTVIAFLALVFAITGGAFAATGHGGGSGSHATLTASAAKSKGKSGPRGPKGATGATGKTGLTGAVGPQGPQGGTGATGATGATGLTGPEGKKGEKGEQGEETFGQPGKNVVTKAFTGKEEPAAEPCKKVGGESVEVENTPPASYVCNGVGGSGYPEVLPEGKTESGTISTALTTGGTAYVPISFTIPLKAAIIKPAVHIVTGEEQTNGTVPPECTIKREGTTIPGSAEAPVAAPGNFCLYEGGIEEATPEEFEVLGPYRPGALTSKNPGVAPAGGVLIVHYHQGEDGGETGQLAGAWAVTAPEAP